MSHGLSIKKHYFGVFKVVPGPHISHEKSKTVSTFLSSEFSTCSTLFAILKVKNKMFTKTEMPELIIYVNHWFWAFIAP